MENNFDNRDFERFVRQNADQFRIFPSENVWKGIHNALHKRRRWYGIGLALLLVTTATVTLVMLIPGYQDGKLAQLGRKLNSAASPATAKTTVSPYIAPVKSSGNDVTTFPTRIGPRYLQDNLQPGNDNADGAAMIAELNTSSLPDNDITSSITRVEQPGFERQLNVDAPHKLSEAGRYSVNDLARPATNNTLQQPAGTIIDNTEEAINKEKIAEEKKAETKLLLPPYTIESVVNSYKLKSNRRKLQWQLYVTPTVSYRTLSENTEFISAARYNAIMSGGGNLNPSYYTTDVNSVVDHKPDLGIQVGVRAAYPVSRWFSFTGGLQLSVSKYDIKATENNNAELATIALTTRNTLSTMTRYRTGDGAKENWLRNFYFSASIPLGMELKLSDGSRNYFGIATTLQPTFVLDNRAYLITTDYKNYAEMPSLTRKFNMNTSFEIFSAHTTGKVQWRIGPQVHYQMMSSFIKNYPIKEHLFDFGLKLGVQLTK